MSTAGKIMRPGAEKPATEGVYRRLGKYNKLGYSYWDGSVWGALVFTIEQAMSHPPERGPSMYQELPWCEV